MLDIIESFTTSIEFTIPGESEPMELNETLTFVKCADGSFSWDSEIKPHLLVPAFRSAVNKRIALLNDLDNDTHFNPLI